MLQGSVARLQVQGNKIRAFALSDDGKSLAVATSGQVRLWKQTEGKFKESVWSTKMQFTGAAGLSFHPDGRRLAIVDGWIGRVSVVDTENGQVALVFDTRSGVKNADIEFSSDGNSLLATLAGELFAWKAANSTDKQQDKQSNKNPNIVYEGTTQSEIQREFKWHIQQAFAQTFGQHYFGAEFHARHALKMIKTDRKKLENSPQFDAFTIYAQCNLAKSLIELGRVEEGTNLLQQAIADCPDKAQTRKSLAYLLATYPGEPIIDPSRMVELAERALKQQPKESSVWAIAGIAYLRNGDHKNARTHLEKAESRMTAQQGLVWFPLAVLNAEEGRFDEATEYFNKAEIWINAFAPSHPVLLQLHRWADEKIRQAER